MRSSFDWPRIYATLVGQDANPPKSAFMAARLIESEIFRRGWIAGEVLGEQTHLMQRYGLSRGTLREAVRLLEDRDVAHMRRGPGGGLIVRPVSTAATVQAMTQYFALAGVTTEHIKQARIALRIMSQYFETLARGIDEVVFSRAFRNSVADRAAAGLWADGALSVVPAGDIADCAFTQLFAAALDALEASSEQVQPTPDYFAARGRAHKIAHELALEVSRVGFEGVERVGTEDELCERYKVSKEVFRQAIRLLESRGVMASQRGRTHGVRTAAKSRTAIVERVVSYLSAERLSSGELSMISRVLSRILRMAFAADSTVEQQLLFLKRLRSDVPPGDLACAITEHLHLEWQCISNPVLVLMERCAAAYNCRLLARSAAYYDASESSAIEHLRSYLQAIIHRQYDDADRVLERFYSEAPKGYAPTERSR